MMLFTLLTSGLRLFTPLFAIIAMVTTLFAHR